MNDKDYASEVISSSTWPGNVDNAEDIIRLLISKLQSQSSSDDQDVTVCAFLEVCDKIDFEDTRLPCDDLFNALLKYGSVPTIEAGNERELDEKDFGSVTIRCSTSLRCFENILKNKTLPLQKITIPCLLLCAQYTQSDLWNTDDLTAQCHCTLEALFARNEVHNVTDLLCCRSNCQVNLVQLFSKLVQPYLTKNGWKCNPGHKSAFGWCLMQLTHPHVDRVLNEVLPPSLLFVDDFILANRLFGITCLCHIMDNTPSADLQRYGRAEVIYCAVKNLVYTREPSLVLVIYPCLLKVLAILERDPRKPSPLRKTNRYDVLLETILHEMESEQMIALRIAYAEVLPLWINVLGITVVKQMKLVMKVILQYLEVYDNNEERTRRNCLHALRSLIAVAWPRIPFYVRTIAKSLFRLCYDVQQSSATSNDIKDAIAKDCVECLCLLRDIAQQEFEIVCRSVSIHFNEIPELLCLKSILEIT